MTSTKYQVFDPPVHMNRTPSPCGRPHEVDMIHIALLKRIVQ